MPSCTISGSVAGIINSWNRIALPQVTSRRNAELFRWRVDAEKASMDRLHLGFHQPAAWLLRQSMKVPDCYGCLYRHSACKGTSA